MTFRVRHDSVFPPLTRFCGRGVPEPAEIRSDLGQNDLRRSRADARDVRKINPCDAVELLA